MKGIRDEAPTFAELGAKGRADEAILLENGQVKSEADYRGRLRTEQKRRD